MPTSKIVNEQEVVRWFNEGRSYQWMIEEYRRKYNLETTPSMWGNFRRRRGLDRRQARDASLIPWAVLPEHRWDFAVRMLRVEARRRTGAEVAPVELERLERWKARLESEGLVVHYDPRLPGGFAYVPRRPDVDTDLIRVPDPAQATGRRAAD